MGSTSWTWMELLHQSVLGGCQRFYMFVSHNSDQEMTSFNLNQIDECQKLLLMSSAVNET